MVGSRLSNLSCPVFFLGYMPPKSVVLSLVSFLRDPEAAPEGFWATNPITWCSACSFGGGQDWEAGNRIGAQTNI